MKILFSALCLCVAVSVFSACRTGNSTNQATGNTSQAAVNESLPPTVSSPPLSTPAASPRIVAATHKPDQRLTNEQVSAAVASMLSDWRISGRVSVKGIQDVQQNSSVADLQFEQFEYAVSYAGELIKAKNFKPVAPSKKLIPSPEEMFPPRKVVYSREGKAILSRYTDGRWMLKEVRWGFDKGVKGSVEIR